MAYIKDDNDIMNMTYHGDGALVIVIVEVNGVHQGWQWHITYHGDGALFIVIHEVHHRPQGWQWHDEHNDDVLGQLSEQEGGEGAKGEVAEVAVELHQEPRDATVAEILMIMMTVMIMMKVVIMMTLVIMMTTVNIGGGQVKTRSMEEWGLIAM